MSGGCLVADQVTSHLRSQGPEQKRHYRLSAIELHACSAQSRLNRGGVLGAVASPQDSGPSTGVEYAYLIQGCVACNSLRLSVDPSDIGIRTANQGRYSL